MQVHSGASASFCWKQIERSTGGRLTGLLSVRAIPQKWVECSAKDCDHLLLSPGDDRSHDFVLYIVLIELQSIKRFDE